MYIDLFADLFVCVSVRACVCVGVTYKKVNPGRPDPMFSKHSICTLDIGETQDIIFFAGQGH